MSDVFLQVLFHSSVYLIFRLLLKNSSLDMAEISERLNFTNPSYFSAIFKKRMGHTPTEYREAEDRH